MRIRNPGQVIAKAYITLTRYLLGLLGEEFSIGRIATHKVHVIGYLSQDSVQTLVQIKFHFSSNLVYVESSVPDLGSGVFLIPGSGIREM